MIGANHASVAIPFEEPHQQHRIHDPDTGDDLLVVTGFAPVRGFVNEQDFIEFRVLASTQGVAVEPLADDVNVDVARDKVVVAPARRFDAFKLIAQRAARQRVAAGDVRFTALGI